MSTYGRPESRDRRATPRRRLSAGRTALIYVGAAGMWIVFSDRLVDLIGIPALHTFKGLAFILFTGAVLYVYLRGKVAQQEGIEARLAETAAGKSRLLAAVSHDLRQPLQSLTLFTNVIEADPGLSPRSRLAAARLGESVARMGQLLGAMLELAQLDQGVVKPQRQPVAVDGLLRSLVEEMGPQAEDKGLAIRHVPSSAVVDSDPVLLLAILRNFVANAIRYSAQGGILLGVRRRADRLLLCVYDTGEGIAPDKLSLVFEEFFQLGNPQRDASLGLGLGLSVVERLSRLLGHRVHVRSRPGRGSAFCIAVPAAVRPPAGPDHPSGDAAS